MAYTTIAVGLNMVDGFADRKRTVVTGFTIIDNATVVKVRRDKASGLMAHTAISTGRNVVTVFTDSDIAIVTGLAVVRNAGMIEPCTGKRRRVMAHRTIFASWQVIIGLACGLASVMT